MAGPSAATVFDVRVEGVSALVGTINSVSIPASGRPVVNFTVKDNFGRGAVGLRAATSGGTMRFNIVKLVEKAAPAGSSEWVPYINRSAAIGDGGTDIQPTSERSGGTLVDFGNGTYEYTMALNVTTVTAPVAVTYDAAKKHRFGIQVSGTPGVARLPPLNLWKDFVPNGTTVALSRDVADEKSCNGCHGNLAVHGGSRSDVQYCVTCHTSGATLGGQSIEMKVMTHKIHMGMNLTTPYMLGNADFSDVGLPQAASNCRTCHNGETGAANITPEGNNWRVMPSIAACGACHDNVNFATGAGHAAGVRTDAQCTNCHDAADIDNKHAATTRTPNNPTGVRDSSGNLLSEFKFEISSVTVNGTDNPVVTFRIQRDGVNMDAAGALPTGITGGPSFLLAYALPQDTILTPADYNNRGRAAAQPMTVSLANLRAGTAGTIGAADSNGFHVATFTGPNAFPAGATLRAVALQGYFSQSAIVPPATTAASFSRPTTSVVKAVTGDTARRVVVSNARCLTCHEMLSLHGGNRTNETGVCVTCHNPNLSSSGRGVDPTLFMTQVNNTTTPMPSATAGSRATYLMFAPGTTFPTTTVLDPLGWPEESNNFKDMIHGIHASHIRSTPFVFVRDRGSSGIYGYDWSHVTYPQVQGNCRSCHTNTGYSVNLPANALPSTVRTTTGATEDRTGVLSARTNVPNSTDHVLSPTAASCTGCHDGFLAKAHMMQNGGVVTGTRADYNPATDIETCGICHGPGKTADIEASHPIIR